MMEAHRANTTATSKIYTGDIPRKLKEKMYLRNRKNRRYRINLDPEIKARINALNTENSRNTRAKTRTIIFRGSMSMRTPTLK